MLGNYTDYYKKLNAVGNSISGSFRPFRVRNVSIHLRDTMNFGGGSLKQLGDMHRIPKVEIGDNIFDMERFYIDDPEMFEVYAMRDAEIAYKHLVHFRDMAESLTGGAEIPHTAGGLGRRFVKKLWEEDNSDTFEQMQHPPDTNFLAPEGGSTPKTMQQNPRLAAAISSFVGSYRGGRNESYAYGVSRGCK